MNNGDNATTPAARDTSPPAPTPGPARRPPRRRAAVVSAVIVAGLTAAGGAAAYATWGTGEDGPRAGRSVGTLEPAGYGRLRLGMTRAEAVATGEIGTAPVGYPMGCEWYSLRGGPEPDPELLRALEQARKNADDAKRKADLANKELRRVTAEASDTAQIVERFEERKAASRVAADALLDVARVLLRQSTRIEAAGGVAFGKDGRLARIAAPPEVHTPEGIGLGSDEAAMTSAYRDRGLRKPTEGSTYEVAASEAQPDRRYSFRVKDGRVVAAVVLAKDITCG
ncbi:hypothetical protein AB0M36_22530 [Actinoplanes sp. NPDC051346]|uniref:hypothetical protein n=1 Tax=Actinoplanes sp. NPDC051346 TaxID=3155048 RepID=UPI0034396D30